MPLPENLKESLQSHRRPVWFTVTIFLALVVGTIILTQPRFPGLPDLAEVEDTGEMKQAFYDYLVPIVDYQNDQIREDRERLAGIVERFDGGEEPGWLETRWIGKLSEEYELAYTGDNLPAVLVTLQRRVDVIPVDLAMAQAALESGWGRSRFAVEANNLFGQRCYEEGCGLAPQGRKSARFEVREFSSVSEAIRRYLNNLNTHERYRGLRDTRAQLRRGNEAVHGHLLIGGLLSYSERGEEYMGQLLVMMRRNRPLLEQAKSEEA